VRKFLITAVMILALPTLAFAQFSANVFASTVSLVPNIPQTITFPQKSRDITIHNGTSEQICVDVMGSGVQTGNDNNCKNANNYHLAGNSDATHYDTFRDSVTLMTMGNKASPVTVYVSW